MDPKVSNIASRGRFVLLSMKYVDEQQQQQQQQQQKAS